MFYMVDPIKSYYRCYYSRAEHIISVISLMMTTGTSTICIKGHILSVFIYYNKWVRFNRTKWKKFCSALCIHWMFFNQPLQGHISRCKNYLFVFMLFFGSGHKYCLAVHRTLFRKL